MNIGGHEVAERLVDHPVAAQQRRGIGRLLLQGVIDRCTAAGFRQMIAIIGAGENNAGSVGLHAACGFRMVGVFEHVGFKHGDWRDTVLMQRAPGVGNTTKPSV